MTPSDPSSRDSDELFECAVEHAFAVYAGSYQRADFDDLLCAVFLCCLCVLCTGF
jgi:hypothetical protein